MALNKTVIFGAGNEPTTPEMDKIVQRAIAAYGYINTKTLKLARRYMIRLDAVDDFMALTNSPSLDLGVNGGEQAWAALLRVPLGAIAGYALCKNGTLGTDQQYAIYYVVADNRFALFLNGLERASTGAQSVNQNELYSLIFYRNSAGLITPYLNKVVKPTATYAGNLTTQPNVRVGRRETAAGYFKGDIASISLYQAPKLDINQILKAEWNIAKDYIA
jgi:hypothetical protein